MGDQAGLAEAITKPLTLDKLARVSKKNLREMGKGSKGKRKKRNAKDAITWLPRNEAFGPPADPDTKRQISSVCHSFSRLAGQTFILM